MHTIRLCALRWERDKQHSLHPCVPEQVVVSPGLGLQSSVWAAMGTEGWVWAQQWGHQQVAGRRETGDRRKAVPGEEEASLMAQHPLYPLAPRTPPPPRLHVPSLCPEPSHAPPVALPGLATLGQHPLLQHGLASLPPPVLGQGHGSPLLCWGLAVLKNLGPRNGDELMPSLSLTFWGARGAKRTFLLNIFYFINKILKLFY